MNTYICVLLALASVAFSCLVVVEPRNAGEDFYYNTNLGMVSATSGNYFVTNDLDEDNALSYHIQIYKIDSQGILRNVSRYSGVQVGGNVFTNGKWFGYRTNVGVYLFKLDSNDQPTAERYWNKMDNGLSWVQMLSDDTMVIYNVNDFSYHIYKFDSGSDDWTEFQIIDGIGTVGASINTAVVDDNYLVAMNTNYVIHIYSRASNGSFIFETTIEMDSQYFLSPYITLYFNGNDTVIISSSGVTYPGESSPGQLIFITKNTEKWTQNVTMEWILPSQIGYVGTGPLLGAYAFGMVDQDNLIFGAPREGYFEAPADKRNIEQGNYIGKALLIQRRNAINSNSSETRNWIPLIDFDSKKNLYFGSAILVIGDYIGITQCIPNGQLNMPCQFWVVPKCIVKPIGLTCMTKEFDSCEIDFTEPFINVTDNLCANNMDVDITFKDYTFTAQYTLDRQFVASESCNATLKCAKPMVPISTPIVIQAPSKPTSGSTSLVVWTALFSFAVIITML